MTDRTHETCKTIANRVRAAVQEYNQAVREANELSVVVDAHLTVGGVSNLLNLEGIRVEVKL